MGGSDKSGWVGLLRRDVGVEVMKRVVVGLWGVL